MNALVNLEQKGQLQTNDVKIKILSHARPLEISKALAMTTMLITEGFNIKSNDISLIVKIDQPELVMEALLLIKSQVPDLLLNHANIRKTITHERPQFMLAVLEGMTLN